MFKSFKRTLTLCLGLVFLLAYACVFAKLSPTSEFYVNDFAGVLSGETKKYIVDNSAALCEKTKAQIVVVTVKSLEGKSVADYSLELFRSWGIGDKKLNNGLLVLLATEDREVKIQVGYGLEGRVNDSKAGRFLDQYGVPYFKNNDWDAGIKALYSALLREVYVEYNLDVPEQVESVIEELPNPQNDSRITAAVVIILVIGICIYVSFSKKHWSGRTDYYGGGFWGGYGGFSGGSGGGFGGFSGGGGSTGGGGASRSF